jgi:CysZ protein
MIEGVSAAAGGMWFVLSTPRVWLYALVPAFWLMLLGCGLTGLGFYGADWSAHALIGEPQSIWGHIGSWSLTLLLAAAALCTAVLLALILAQPLSGFALEAIVLEQERALLGENLPRSSFLTALWTSTRATLVMLIVGGLVYTVLFVIDFCFPPAIMVTALVQFLVGGWLLAWNFLDYPLSVRGLGVWARLRWATAHIEEFTMFGVMWAGLLIVPGMFLLILPMGVAGATRLVVESELARARTSPVA